MIPFSRFSTLFHIIDWKSFRQEAGHLIVAISIFLLNLPSLFQWSSSTIYYNSVRVKIIKNKRYYLSLSGLYLYILSGAV